MSAVAACVCARCGEKQHVWLPPKTVNFTRYLAAYACEACGVRQVRLDLPGETVTLDNLPAVTT